MKKFFIRTMGCQMNVADSDLICAHLSASGFEPCEDINEAGIIVLNTCTVRQQAENRALSFIGRLRKLKRKKPGLKIIVAGCVAERLGNNIRSQFPYVDLVTGAKNIEYFPEAFDKTFDISLKHGRSDIPHDEPGSISRFVTIMRGCENFCSYCIVPYVRGKEVSRSAEDILNEVRNMVKNGTKEITLLGQNVNSYKGQGTRGKGQGELLDFADLLGKVNEIKGLERIRFMTSHPKDLSDKLIYAVKNLDKVCEHIHLPLQSASDRILKAMNRKYTSKDYLKIINRMKKEIPGISITTDILVGFPGETKSDFNATLKLVKDTEFDFLFAFKYSPREGTEAAKIRSAVPAEEKERRHALILETTNGISARKNAKLIGTSQEVLVEGKKDNDLTGSTRTNKKVFIKTACPGNSSLTGRLVSVKIEKSKINSLIGNQECANL